MKQSTNSCNSLKWLLLAAIFTACNTDQIVPSKETAQVVSNQNAKGNVLLRLVKRGASNIQYVKSGKFFGKVSKVTGATYRTEYTYDDNNPGGLLKIDSKRYNKLTNALVEEIQYKVSNGFCIGSSNATTLAFSEYYYAQNHLDEIKDYQALGGAPIVRKFSYNYSAATNAYRLNKIEATNSIGLIVDFANITYSQKSDNYVLNPDYTDLDKYLPIFGQFSDLLPEAYVEDSKKADGSQLSHKFTYGLDNDGYVTWEQIEHSAGNGSPKWYDSAILQYSSNWQGI